MLRSKRQAKAHMKSSAFAFFTYRHGFTREQEKLTTQMWF